MSTPLPKEIARSLHLTDLDEFQSGWRDGAIRCMTNPASIEVIEDLVLLLDSSALVERITLPE